MLTPKHYRFAFDPWGVALFLTIMIPNFVWFALPAPNDILRRESITPLLDAIAQVFQVIMAAALCAVVNTARKKPMPRGYRAAIVLCVLLYFAGWATYYAGATNAAVILDLCLAPCGAFLLFALGRKNIAALIPAGGFALCHLIYGAANFIIIGTGPTAPAG